MAAARWWMRCWRRLARCRACDRRQLANSRGAPSPMAASIWPRRKGWAICWLPKRKCSARPRWAIPPARCRARSQNGRTRLLSLSAQVEAALDFSDEDDVADLPANFHVALREFAGELGDQLDRPVMERLQQGVRIVFAGPPNAGKSSLFNALTRSEAAITAPSAGTTRDVIERTHALHGVPLTFVDTAGLRGDSVDPVEIIGIDRARMPNWTKRISASGSATKAKGHRTPGKSNRVSMQRMQCPNPPPAIVCRHTQGKASTLC